MPDTSPKDTQTYSLPSPLFPHSHGGLLVKLNYTTKKLPVLH